MTQTGGAQLVCTTLSIYYFPITPLKLRLGVLTKPDRIPEGEAGNWLSFIRNEKEPLTNGWYAVKQPGSQAIENGITWAQAREEEDRFFTTEPGWCDLDAMHQKYLKTSNLVARLSEILSDLISKRFVSSSNPDHSATLMH